MHTTDCERVWDEYSQEIQVGVDFLAEVYIRVIIFITFTMTVYTIISLIMGTSFCYASGKKINLFCIENGVK